MGGNVIDYRYTKKANKRENFRANLNIEAQYSLDDTQSKCTVLDISNTGMGLKVPQFLTEGDVLTVYFEIPEYGRVKAKVNVVFMKGTKVGCNFISIDDQSRQVINRYIDKFASKNLRKFFK
jgi:c-di-GMP-binding flagellar brake protein YcgR